MSRVAQGIGKRSVRDSHTVFVKSIFQPHHFGVTQLDLLHQCDDVPLFVIVEEFRAFSRRRDFVLNEVLGSP